MRYHIGQRNCRPIAILQPPEGLPTEYPNESEQKSCRNPTSDELPGARSPNIRFRHRGSLQFFQMRVDFALNPFAVHRSSLPAASNYSVRTSANPLSRNAADGY